MQLCASAQPSTAFGDDFLSFGDSGSSALPYICAVPKANRLRTRKPLVAALVLMVTPFLVAGGLAAPASAEGGVSPSIEESGFVDRINTLRASRGLAALRVDPQLSEIARGWAKSMGGGQCRSDVALQHNPLFVPPSGVMSPSLATSWKLLRENVGCGFPIDVESLHQAFVASHHHFENMVDPKVDSIGVGTFVDSAGIFWVAEDFGDYDPVKPATAGPATPRESTGHAKGGKVKVTSVGQTISSGRGDDLALTAPTSASWTARRKCGR